MNKSRIARSAYADVSAPVRTPRSVEYQAFAKVTSALSEAAAAAQKDPADNIRRIEALHLNSRLWAILGDDVQDDRNGLPFDLRQKIYSLSRFVNKQTPMVLDGKAEIGPLIEINTAIMRGLRGDIGG